MGSFFSKTWEKAPIGVYSPSNTNVPRDTKSCAKKRILLIGTAGSGKSSIINSVYSVYGEHVERAKYGGGSAGHVTKIFKKYDLSQIRDEPKTQIFKKHQLPTFFDMCGLPPHDSPNDRFEEVLWCILNGRLPLGTNVHELLLNEEATIPKCKYGDPIDRVVFVAAADEELPTNYCDSVIKVCEKVFGAEFTVFGILTKGDQMKPKTSEKYKKITAMMQADGAEQRVLVIANYCSAVCGGLPTTWKNRKDIDGPILAFLAEISRPEYDKRRKVN